MFLQCFQGGNIVVNELQALIGLCCQEVSSAYESQCEFNVREGRAAGSETCSVWCFGGPEMQHGDESVTSAAGSLYSNMHSRQVYAQVHYS